jgi:lactate permease
MDVFLALLPILVVLFLLIFRRTAADLAGLAGWGLTLLIALVFFDTPLRVSLQASLAGVIASFPITLMVAASILQITIMLECGAVTRIVALIKTVSPTSQVVQIMIVNIGAGTLLAALGATPVSI